MFHPKKKSIFFEEVPEGHDIKGLDLNSGSCVIIASSGFSTLPENRGLLTSQSMV